MKEEFLVKIEIWANFSEQPIFFCVFPEKQWFMFSFRENYQDYRLKSVLFSLVQQRVRDTLPAYIRPMTFFDEEHELSCKDLVLLAFWRPFCEFCSFCDRTSEVGKWVMKDGIL